MKMTVSEVAVVMFLILVLALVVVVAVFSKPATTLGVGIFILLVGRHEYGRFLRIGLIQPKTQRGEKIDVAA